MLVKAIYAGVAFLLILICVFVIVLFPLGFVARAALMVAALFAIILAWGLRSQKNKVPDRLLFNLMMLIVALSVAWPRYVFFSAGSLPKVNPQTLSVMAGLGLILLFSIYSPSFSKRISVSAKNGGVVFVLAATWLLWRLLANFLGTYPVIATLDYLRETLYLSSFLLFGLVIASYDNGPKKMLHLLILVGLFVGLAGLVEAFQQKNMFVGFASQDAEGDLAGILSSIAADKSRGGAYRVQSTFGHPILYAQFFAALMPLALYGAIFERKWIWRVLSFIVIPITLIAILKSGSRAGIVSFVVAVGFLAVLLWFRAIVHGRTSKFVAILALPLLGIGIGIVSYVLQGLAAGSSQIESSSTEVRKIMINNAIDVLWNSPLWGFGQGSALAKAGIINTKGLATLDNYFLNISVDSGYVGLILFLLLLVTFGAKGFKFSVLNKGEDGMFVGACVAGALALFTTFSIVSINDNMTFLWLIITATFSYINQNQRKVVAKST